MGRVAALRLVVYGFIPLDVLWWDRWVRERVAVPGDWYRPLAVGRLLHLPVPTAGLCRRSSSACCLVPHWP